MRDKKQKIKYINGCWCDVINECYLDIGWNIVSIYPVSNKTDIGAYILLEKEEDFICPEDE